MKDKGNKMDNQNQNFNPNQNQIIVTGYIKETRQGEAIKFHVNLAFFRLTCIVNIPGEGEESAPVYCRFGLTIPQNEREESETNIRMLRKRRVG